MLFPATWQKLWPSRFINCCITNKELIMEGPKEFDLNPHPRILPMLGEINLAQWRCLAELVDNSVDAFLSAKRADIQIDQPEVNISLPTSDDALSKITVRDNGP